MSRGLVALVVGLGVGLGLVAVGQQPARPPASAPPGAASARIETARIAVTPPDRYLVPSTLVASRRVAIRAPVDGIVRTVTAAIGASVRENQELLKLDPAEASARLKEAQAGVREREAEVKAAASNAAAQARLEAAQARAELAQLELDRCTQRAPFAGLILDVPVAPGQYVAQGSTLAELADVSSLRVLLPMDRAAAEVGKSLELNVEGRTAPGKILALLPLPEPLGFLRELATPMTAAWVAVDNPKGQLEPGQRVWSPSLPTAPIAVVPRRAVRDRAGQSIVQVIRNEYVVDVPVRLLGEFGDDRVQVTGPLGPDDALIVQSSIELAARTLVRFGTDPSRPAEAAGPDPNASGILANITLPPGSGPIGPAARADQPRPAPIAKPAAPVAKPAGAGAVPFD